MAVWVSINDLNCHSCNAQIKQVRGCEVDIPAKLIEGVEVKRCPVKLITAQSKAYLQAYSFYKDGFLPNVGGALDQSAKVMEAIRHIADEVERLTKKD